MLTSNDIIKTLEKNMNAIQQYGVKKIGLFGSFARNDQTENSDINLLMEFESEKETYENYMGLLLFLEKLFSKKVDLVMYDAVREELKEEICGSVKCTNEA